VGFAMPCWGKIKSGCVCFVLFCFVSFGLVPFGLVWFGVGVLVLVLVSSSYQVGSAPSVVWFTARLWGRKAVGIVPWRVGTGAEHDVCVQVVRYGTCYLVVVSCIVYRVSCSLQEEQVRCDAIRYDAIQYYTIPYATVPYDRRWNSERYHGYTESSTSPDTIQ